MHSDKRNNLNAFEITEKSHLIEIDFFTMPNSVKLLVLNEGYNEIEALEKIV